jgi:hypothetical protein
MKCFARLCNGNPVGSPCLSHSECEIGYACSEIDGFGGVCQAQVGEGSKCSDDYQCLNNLGCENRFCVKYNSRPNGTPTTSENYCVSGMIRTLNNQIICDSVSLVERKCTETEDSCKYIWDTDLATKEITGCTCDLNPLTPQARHCEPAPVGATKATLSTAHTLLRFNVYSYYEPVQPYSECINGILMGAKSTMIESFTILAIIASLILIF